MSGENERRIGREEEDKEEGVAAMWKVDHHQQTIYNLFIICIRMTPTDLTIEERDIVIFGDNGVLLQRVLIEASWLYLCD